jgi:G3E family GTPase
MDDQFTEDDLKVEGEATFGETVAEIEEPGVAATPDPAAETRRWVEEHSTPGKDGKPYFPPEVFAEIVRPAINEHINGLKSEVQRRDEELTRQKVELEELRAWQSQFQNKIADDDLKVQEEQLREQAIKARRDDDANAEFQAMEKLAEVKAQRLLRAQMAQRVEAERKPAAPVQQPPQQVDTRPPAQRQWADRHGANLTKEVFVAASQVYDELTQRYGYNPNDPNLYVAIDQELERRKVVQPQPTERPRTVSSAATPGGRTPPAPVNRVRLDKSDLERISEMGYDPNDKATRASFLKAKMARQEK